MKWNAVVVGVGALLVIIAGVVYMNQDTMPEGEQTPEPIQGDTTGATPEPAPQVDGQVAQSDTPALPSKLDTNVNPKGTLSAQDLAKYQARVKDLNDREDYSILSGPDEYVNYSEDIGTWNGKTVQFAFKCWGDTCPFNGAYFLTYKDVPKEACEALGGHIVEGYSGWGAMTYGGCSPVKE